MCEDDCKIWDIDGAGDWVVRMFILENRQSRLIDVEADLLRFILVDGIGGSKQCDSGVGVNVLVSLDVDADAKVVEIWPASCNHIWLDV